MRMVLLGPPGAGKGTHAKIIKEKYELAHLATGDILRRNIKQGTGLGVQAKETIEKGALVSDELINEMMFSEIKEISIISFIFSKVSCILSKVACSAAGLLASNSASASSAAFLFMPIRDGLSI